jgi:hypothetical protein
MTQVISKTGIISRKLGKLVAFSTNHKDIGT